MNNNIYFDSAATTQLAPEVLEAMTPYLKNFYGNPSSTHYHGREVKSAVEKVRKQIADTLNCTTSEIFFTSGGTEADNTIINGALRAYGMKNAITSKIEHHAVLHTLEHLRDAGKIDLHFVNLYPDGSLDYEHLETLLKQYPESLVSLMHANNEIGNINDIKRIGTLVQQHGSFLHSDTVQTIGHYKIDLSDNKVCGLAAAAHKFHGPKGVGFMYVNKNHPIHAFITGGSQERDMRGGTENVAGIVGLGKAFELAYANLDEETTKIQGLKSYFIQRLNEAFPDVTFNGRSGEKDSLYTVLNVRFPHSFEKSMLLFNLDISGISASGGSACSSGSPQGSHVLEALDIDPEKGSVRFSLCKYNTTEEVDRCIEVLKEIEG